MSKLEIGIYYLILIILGSGSCYGLGKYHGYEDATQEIYAKLNQEIKENNSELKTELNTHFSNYQQILNKMQERNNEKLISIQKTYSELGNCHNNDGIGMLNDEIRKRYRYPLSTP